jgi:hypothetical protein
MTDEEAWQEFWERHSSEEMYDLARTLHGHLRALVAVYPVTYDGLDDPICLYCYAELRSARQTPRSHRQHKEDCPWRKARALLEQGQEPTPAHSR